ncbi:MAG: hypothetical protein D6675_13895 [Gemmatimonadetes bacterium]|nr:MAG: hypothetical protein D6675_13895 [Gemmatimonadota bacterium]
MKYAVPLVLFIGLISAGTLLAQKAVPPGKIDYMKGIVTATGIGTLNPNVPEQMRRPVAIKAAKLDAFRNLLDQVKRVQLDGTTTVESQMLASDYLHTQVEGVVKNFEVTNTQYRNDGTVEITVQLSLYGELADILLPPQSAAETPPTARDETPTYTGVVLDARGLDVQPALAPNVLNEQEQPVYGFNKVARTEAITHGVVGYYTDPEQAKKDPRHGDKPLEIKVIRTTENKVDLIISNADAATLKSNVTLLKKANVLVLID